jgi:hypothetical protein
MLHFNGLLFFIHCLCESLFFHIQRPSGLAILPNLPRYQWLEVCLYVFAIDASHIRQTYQLQDLGLITFSNQTLEALLYVTLP